MMTDVPTSELLGLAGTFPRPGWVVLDAARDQRFTGEIVVDVLPQARVHMDRGRIYLAERATDPSLGARLVDAGALHAIQLEQGSIRLADGEHLGRLFERVPSVDRDAVIVVVELMTEECVGWIAAQQVPAIAVTPYRHHPSGVHRWEAADLPDQRVEPAGAPLPAPAPGQSPVALTVPPPPTPPSPALDSAGEEVIRWDEPAWLDGAFDLSTLDSSPATASPAATEPTVAEPAPIHPPDLRESLMVGDWIDRLESHGLPEPGSDPLATVASMRPLPVEPADRFEVIWPSGEVDEQFGTPGVAERPERHPDLDRAGPTARIVRSSDPELTLSPGVARDAERSRRDAEASHDDVVLAVRRAVASIETSSIEARRRLIEPHVDPLLARDAMATPGSSVATAPPAPRLPGGMSTPTRSVFDDIVIEPARPAGEPLVGRPADQQPEVGGHDRSSALRRLIGSLRRR